MPYFRTLGHVPRKRHVVTEFEGAPIYEEFLGEEGFAGAGSMLYHRFIPSALTAARDWDIEGVVPVSNRPNLPRHLRLPDLFPDGGAGKDAVRHRRYVLANEDLRIAYVVAGEVSPLQTNGIGDEVFYIEEGDATIESIFGSLRVGQGDTVVIPRMTIHRWVPESTLKAYIVEASGHVQIPRRFKNEAGQFLMGAPLTERDFRVPQELPVIDPERAQEHTEVYVRHRGVDGIYGSVVTYDHHPFDVVGWDGHVYPYAFHNSDISPVTGEIIQPPPTYQILEGRNFVVCNFTPRMLEWHPQALHVPYYHSNVDADEVMFYHSGSTTARAGTGIANASVSLHPAAYTHGPTAPAYLNSPKMESIADSAWMVDTFNPLGLCAGGKEVADDSYAWAWAKVNAQMGASEG